MKIKELTEEIDIKLAEETSIKILKTYFNDKRNKSFEYKKEAGMAIGDILFYSDDVGDCGVEWGIVREGVHAKDIFCSFETQSDGEKLKNILTSYGFTLQKNKNGFWITGVKE